MRFVAFLPLVALVLLLATPVAADARIGPAPTFLRGASDGRLSYDPNPLVPAVALRTVAAFGGRVVRVPVHWRRYVDGRARPKGDLSDPANSAYVLRGFDISLRRVVAAGLEPMLYFLVAPQWAEARGRWEFARPGTWAPDPAALADFAKALARRYDGTYVDPRHPDDGPLPRVRRFQPWNEPNLPNYLQPQWVVRGERWEPFAAFWYRRMQNAVSDAIHAVQPDAEVGTAGTAPVGEAVDGAGRIAPVRFWHAFLCLEPPPSTRAVGCDDPPAFDAISLHPLSVGSPDRRAEERLDFAIADIGKIQRAVTIARSRGTARTTRAPKLWITELNWESGPPPRVPASRQAGFVSRGLHRLWAAGAELVLWHFVTDPASLLDGRSRPAGLTRRLPDGQPGPPKPFLRAFAFPLTATRVAPREIRVWTDLPAAAGGTAMVERKRDGKWFQIGRIRLRAAGEAPVKLTGRAVLRLRANGQTTAAVTVGGG